MITNHDYPLRIVSLNVAGLMIMNVRRDDGEGRQEVDDETKFNLTLELSKTQSNLTAFSFARLLVVLPIKE